MGQVRLRTERRIAILEIENGVFEVLAEDGEKYDFRRLTVRCTRCGAVAERSQASVRTRRGAACGR